MSDALLSTSVNVVEEGTIEVDVHAAIDLMVKDERYYAGFGPGQWLVAVPYYVVLRPIIGLLPHAEKTWANNNYAYKRPKALPLRVIYLQIAMVWFFLGPLTGFFFAKLYQVLRRTALTPSYALAGTLAASTGTLIATYSCVYSRQWLATLLIALVALRHLPGWREAPGWGRRSRYVYGLLLGYAVAVDYIAVFGVALVALFHLLCERDKRDALPLLGGVATIAVLMAFYHLWLVGHPLKTPYQFRVWHDHNLGFSYKGQWYNFGQVTQNGIVGMGLLPSWAALWGLTFGTFKGLFFFSPILLFGLAGLVSTLRDPVKKPVAYLCLAQFLAYFWAIASTNGEIFWSSWPIFFGPRYLIYGVPFLTFGLAWVRLERTWWRALFLAALVASCAVHVLGLMFHERNLVASLEAPSVQAPIPHLAGWLVKEGPRVPLLDQNFFTAPGWVQILVFLGYLGALTACVVLVRSRERSDPLATRAAGA